MSTNELIAILGLERVIRGADLLLRLQRQRPTMSRATLMRLIKKLDRQVVKGGAAQRASYALRRSIRGNDQTIPLFKINQAGKGVQVATLDPIYPNGCLLTVNDEFEWPLPLDMRDGWCVGLPYPLDDMRPQGYLGRHFAQAHAPNFQVSSDSDPTKWNEDDVLAVISVLGSDTQSNLILGEAAYKRHLLRMQEGYQPIPNADIAEEYEKLSIAAMANGVANSSAGGEFPKFTTCRLLNDVAAHVIVKFSGNDQSSSVQRWSDLLICEHIALNIIQTYLPLKAANSAIIHSKNRTFLEVVRFDRHGEFGRSAVCTWAAIEAAFFGMAGSSWIEGAQRLLKEAYISKKTQEAIHIIWFFGKLIANTDMHEGNIAFQTNNSHDAQAIFELAPIYDMLPMWYAPMKGVEISSKIFKPELPMPADVVYWKIAADAATTFWEHCANDERISSAFKIICLENVAILKKAILTTQVH